MPAWLLWLIFGLFLVLPVFMRACAGDDVPDNSITYESGDDEDPDGPDGLLAAALGWPP